MVKVSPVRAAELRDAVLDAGVTELARVGAAEVAVTEVARRARVATSVVYRRFATKEILLEAVAAERLEPTVGRWLDRRISAFGNVDVPGLTPPPREHRAAWSQLLLAAPWPGPARGPAQRCVAVRAAPYEEASALVAIDLGSWLLSSGLARREPPGVTRTPLSGSALTIVATDPPAPSGAARTDALGRALLVATATTVAEMGYAESSVHGIAERAGTSTGAIYNRFSGKGGLLAECLRAGTDIDHTATVGETRASATRMAVQVEALRVATRDAEVASAVAATAGRALTRRAALVRAAGRDGSSDPGTSARVTAWLLTASELGGWVVELIRPGLSEPTGN